MKDLLRNIRFYTLFLSFAVSLIFLVFIKIHYGSDRIETIRFQQYSALTAVFFLYLALLAGPFCYVFKFFPFRPQYIKARRALGVSAFYFGLLHASVSFFGQLGGFGGLAFLSSKYILAISLSFTALVVLFMMALTSFDSVIEKMSYKKWKILHRCVYLAGFFIIIHALMLGTHFQDLSTIIPQIFFSMLFFLLGLEALRMDFYLRKKLSFYPSIGFATSFIAVLFVVWIVLPYLPSSSGGVSLGIHAKHIQQAKDNTGIVKNTVQQRISVQLDKPKDIEPNTPVQLSFTITNSTNANSVTDFDLLHEKIVHLIIVDDNLETFQHVHPEVNGNVFTSDVSFPDNGSYHAYIDFQPKGGGEEQFSFSIKIGNEELSKKTISLEETNKTENEVDGYRVSLSYTEPFLVKDLTSGNGKFYFNIVNSDTGKGVTTLKPYLGAFGHLVMINSETFEYIHVHPIETPETYGPNGGPRVSFIPLALYGNAKKGTYRMFAQFNPNSKLITVPFTVIVN